VDARAIPAQVSTYAPGPPPQGKSAQGRGPSYSPNSPKGHVCPTGHPRNGEIIIYTCQMGKIQHVAGQGSESVLTAIAYRNGLLNLFSVIAVPYRSRMVFNISCPNPPWADVNLPNNSPSADQTPTSRKRESRKWDLPDFGTAHGSSVLGPYLRE